MESDKARREHQMTPLKLAVGQGSACGETQPYQAMKRSYSPDHAPVSQHCQHQFSDPNPAEAEQVYDWG